MRTTFSSDEIAELRRNPCVFDCTKKSVYYTHEFKQRALELRAEGVYIKEIWRRSGFDVSKWKDEYFRGTLRDWRTAVEKHGIDGLTNPGGTPHDRGPDHTCKDTLKRLELQVKYLQAENDFLAKLRAKRAESNSGRMKNTNSLER
jgi:transposase-like protein